MPTGNPPYGGSDNVILTDAKNSVF
jgi:hypothetical protein